MKRILLIALLITVSFMVACNGTDTTGPGFDPFIGGQDGVVMEFIEGMPPSQEGAILDGGKTPFSIGLKLTNAGEHNIAEGDYLELQLKGILPEQFGLTNDDMSILLEDPLPGAKKNIDSTIQAGQFTTLTFDGLRYIPDTRGDLPKTFQVELCYDYSTKSTTQVCIADDVTKAITNADDQRICSVNGIKEVKNSGGPVQITELKQLPQGDDKISVIFTISQVNMNGNVFMAGSPNRCDYSLQNQDKDFVHLTLSLPEESSATISCMGGEFTGTGNVIEGDVKMFEASPRSVTCTIAGNTNQDIIYTDLLSIDMEYAFGQVTETSVIIKDLGTTS